MWIILNQLFWNFKRLFITAVVRYYIIFENVVAILLAIGREPPPGRKDTSKYTKLMFKLYVCNNLNQTHFFSFSIIIIKGMSFRNVLENRLEENRLISHIYGRILCWKIMCSFLKINCYNFYTDHVSQKKGGR